jgi:hypothetical protein
MGIHTFTETIEERVARLTHEALEAAEHVQRTAPSRDNSLCVTHLEDALYRAGRDLEAKGGR